MVYFENLNSFLKNKNLGFKKRSYIDLDLFPNNEESFLSASLNDAKLTSLHEGIAQEVILALFNTIPKKQFFSGLPYGFFDSVINFFTFDSFYFSLYFDFVSKNFIPILNERLEMEENPKIESVVLNNLDLSDPNFFVVNITFNFDDGVQVVKNLKIKK